MINRMDSYNYKIELTLNLTPARTVTVGEVPIGGGHPLVLIAGPCVIEGEELTLETAEQIRTIAERVGIPFIFKASYEKDNRFSAQAYRGPGLKEGLRILARVKEELGVPVLSDVHCRTQVGPAAEVLDIIQIPAYLCMQTELTLTVAQTGKVVNVKKGQFLDPHDMRNVVGKIESVGNSAILLTERGSCFGYHNLVVDMRSLPVLRSLGYPVVFDVTHTVRIHGRPSSEPSGGEPEFIPYLSRAAVAVGCDALFIETHPRVSEALCDAASMLPLEYLEGLLAQVKAIDELVKQWETE